MGGGGCYRITPKDCTRLAEVDFQIAEVLKCAVQDLPASLKSGHRPARSRFAIRRVAN